MDPQILMQINEIYRNEVYAEPESADINHWVSQLISEGYNLDDYSDEELYEAYLEDLDEAKMDKGKTDVEKRATRRERLVSGGNLSPGMSVDEIEVGRQWAHRRSRGMKKTEAKSRPTFSGKYGSMQRRKGMREEIDLYDIVSEYLVSEGFCDSYEDADVIMVNISEQWIDGILDEVTGGGQVRFRKGLPGDKPKKRGMKDTPQEKAARQLGRLDVNPTTDPQRRARLAKVALR